MKILKVEKGKIQEILKEIEELQKEIQLTCAVNEDMLKNRPESYIEALKPK